MFAKKKCQCCRTLWEFGVSSLVYARLKLLVVLKIGINVQFDMEYIHLETEHF